MKSRILSATLAVLVAASPVVAGEEPFGMGFDGWRFTQEDRKDGILCRAILGQNIIARFTDGKMYVSMPAGKVPAGSYPETHLDIGGTSEPVDAKSDGKRFWLNSDAGLLDKLATARGYYWRTGPVKGQFVDGRVAFNASTGKALKELQNCTEANGGAKRPAPGASAQLQQAPSGGIGWIETRAGTALDRRAVAVGTMPDGLPVFACIAKANGGLHPGMTGVWIHGCSTGFGGKEVISTNYSLMTGTGRWVRASNGQVPPQALQGGNEANGAALFICRASYKGGVYAGKVRPGFNGCNIADLGAERIVNPYEVLAP